MYMNSDFRNEDLEFELDSEIYGFEYEKEIAYNYVVKPIYIVSVSGEVDDEYCKLKIELNNGDKIKLDSYLEIGPGDYYYKTSKINNPSYAKITIKSNGETKKYDVYDKYLEFMCEYDSVVQTAMKIYESYL